MFPKDLRAARRSSRRPLRRSRPACLIRWWRPLHLFEELKNVQAKGLGNNLDCIQGGVGRAPLNPGQVSLVEAAPLAELDLAPALLKPQPADTSTKTDRQTRLHSRESDGYALNHIHTNSANSRLENHAMNPRSWGKVSEHLMNRNAASIAVTLTICLVAAFIGQSATAANISIDATSDSIVQLDGEIVVGDAERLVQTFLQIKGYDLSGGKAKPVYIFPNSLELSSKGGDVAEAMRLATVVRAMGLSVSVAGEGKGVCASSCFLLFLAGVPRNATGIDTIRRRGVRGNLGPVGVHRPYLAKVQDGIAGATHQNSLMSQMTDYLRRESVPQSLIDKMMTHASNDIYWLSQSDLHAMGEYPPGVEEQLISICGYDRSAAGKMSAAEWIRDSQTGVGNCVSSYVVKHYLSPAGANAEKMRGGWRPW